MAFSPLSKLKQKRTLEFKKKKPRNLSKKPTSPVCKARKEEGENTLQIVKCYEQKVDSSSQSCALVNKNPLAFQLARELQDNLEHDFPSFVKLMLRSHVTGCFWLGIPVSFCRKNMPKHDETVVLIGENYGEYKTKYLAAKTGLSGGWMAFAVEHNLLEGDALVFQLVEEWTFKVFIVRASGLSEIGGAISLLNLHADAEAKTIDLVAKTVPMVEEESICETLMQRNGESPLSCSDQAYSQDNSPSDQFGNGSLENSGSDILDEVGFLESEAFKILVNGSSVDSEVYGHTRTRYYELCRSQQCYLHERLIAGLNLKLVAGIISETVNVADAIRAAKLITPLGYLETWDNTLKSFEGLGMAVGFLRERLKKLKAISYDQQKKVETKTCHRTTLEEELTSLKLKLLDTERAIRSVDDELDSLKVEEKKLELTFKKAASAPW